jgi:DNA-binding XRE family transcriptional regulator
MVRGTRTEFGKEVKTMVEEIIERRRRISAIKREARSLNGGRSYLLQGLWACRQAAGLTQRQVAKMMGSSPTTVRKLERLTRGDYPQTMQRLCWTLAMTPEDLLKSLLAGRRGA